MKNKLSKLNMYHFVFVGTCFLFSFSKHAHEISSRIPNKIFIWIYNL